MKTFSPGVSDGVFSVDGLRIGVRICYEVRFPEYFRELHRSGTDLNIVLFYDVAIIPDANRYNLIKAHLQTRAVENVTHFLSVNSSGPSQIAPTALFDKSGTVLSELIPGAVGLMVYDLTITDDSIGEAGRRSYSYALT